MLMRYLSSGIYGFVMYQEYIIIVERSSATKSIKNKCIYILKNLVLILVIEEFKKNTKYHTLEYNINFFAIL